MKQIIPKQNKSFYNSSIEQLQNETNDWLSEIEFIKIEQEFLNELLTDYIIGLCETDNFNKAKLFLNGIAHESKLGSELKKSIKDHRMNLALLLENIYLKKENDFRKTHELLLNEVKNYIQNFKYIKQQVFELVLFIMKLDKKQKLLMK
ncbi:hypothetical protein BX611_1296 [Lutibacter oceani]|uniref:Uncharacterized protein n=1 Tax=Lutibacter oceani TaxID=1853311 RepID=A0A3D9RPB6_9FLAO|nr:hypothetical protein [Lutibacter oceani]REE81760.1 hypothetical protein BX611_1296 [Lutibacter oceani]